MYVIRIIFIIAVIWTWLLVPTMPAHAGDSNLKEGVAMLTGTGREAGAPPSRSQSLNGLLPGLPAADEQPLTTAMAKLPAALEQRAIAALRSLTRQQRQTMVAALREVLDPLSPANRQALADVLLGVGTADEQSLVAALTARRLQRFGQALGSLAAVVSGGDQQVLQFLQTLFQTLVPHIDRLLAAAFLRVPVAAQPLVLAEDVTQLQQLDPRSIVLAMLMLQDGQSAALVQSAGYQAGYACGLGNCTSFDTVVIYLSGVPVIPGVLQQAYVDCVLTPICTSAERLGLIDYIQQLYVEGKISYDQRQTLVNEVWRAKNDAVCHWIGAVDCPQPS